MNTYKLAAFGTVLVGGIAIYISNEYAVGFFMVLAGLSGLFYRPEIIQEPEPAEVIRETSARTSYVIQGLFSGKWIDLTLRENGEEIIEYPEPRKANDVRDIIYRERDAFHADDVQVVKRTTIEEVVEV